MSIQRSYITGGRNIFNNFMVTLGQIGIGNWGQNLLRTFSNLTDCRVKICCDQNEKSLEKVKKNYSNTIHVTTHFEEILKDPDIQAVVIATLPVSHASLACEVLSAGKHVFVEKPMALDVQSAQKMIQLSRRHNKFIMVGHLLLYHPAIRKLKLYIEENFLGEIHYLYSTRVNLGQIREEENALWSLTAHDISVAMYLLNQNPSQVWVTGKAYLRESIHDVVFVTLNFENNAISHIHASWLDPHKIRKFTVVGSKKMAVFDDMESMEKIRLYDKGVSWQKNAGNYDAFLTLRHGDIYIPKIEMIEPLKLECQHFIDCIMTHTEPFTNGSNGMAVLKVLTAAQESLESNGKPVQIF